MLDSVPGLTTGIQKGRVRECYDWVWVMYLQEIFLGALKSFFPFWLVSIHCFVFHFMAYFKSGLLNMPFVAAKLGIISLLK